MRFDYIRLCFLKLIFPVSLLVELTSEVVQFIVALLVVAIPIAVYVARLHWKINMLERRINDNPLLSAFSKSETEKGFINFVDSVLKRGEVESKT